MGTTWSIGADERRGQVRQIVDHLREDELYKDLAGKTFDFENLVLSGGGVKGLAYGGMILALHDLGILQKIKRYAGASAGALACIFLAIGFTPEEIIEYCIFAEKLVMDKPLGCAVCNIFRYYGCFDGSTAMDFVESQIQRKLGNSMMTFDELYQQRGVELCLTVTNVSSMQVEYCHPKTTPDMPLVTAIRMTTALPPLLQPVTVDIDGLDFKETIYYSDGGILANYPIYAYDGWYLNMDRNKSFLHMIHSEEPPFGAINDKTLGVALFNATEIDNDNINVIQQKRFPYPEVPNTKTARERYEATHARRVLAMRKVRLAEQATEFLSQLSKADKDHDGFIDAGEMEEALKDKSKLSDEDLLNLFNARRDETSKIMEELDNNGDGKITYDEVLWFMQRKGLNLKHVSTNQFVGNGKVTSMLSFMNNVLDCMQSKSKSKRKEDTDRTMNIFCDYVWTADNGLVLDDRKYCMKLAWISTLHHLSEYSSREKTQNQPNRKDPKKGAWT